MRHQLKPIGSPPPCCRHGQNKGGLTTFKREESQIERKQGGIVFFSLSICREIWEGNSGFWEGNLGAAGAPQGGNFRRRRRRKEGNQGAAGAPGGRFRCRRHGRVGRGFEGNAGTMGNSESESKSRLRFLRVKPKSRLRYLKE